MLDHQCTQAAGDLAVQLADTRLADFHHCVNLTQIEFLLLTKAEQQPFPLQNGFNGLNQPVPQAGFEQLV